jgi:drug/metabolite transporter (DMT)-like permease
LPADALALALLAAVVHAGWNLLIADAEDPQAAAPVALAVGAVVLLPFGIATWDVDAAAWPYIAASIAFELAYFALLARAYARAELAFVYPIARGSAPVLALIASAAFFGAAVSLAAAIGVAAVVAGIVLVRGVGRASSRDLLLALGVGACIAGYTVVDDRGVEHASPVAYLSCVLVPTALAWLAVARPRIRVTPRIGGAGIGMVVAYLLTLAALDRAAAGPVAAVRETSVLFAVGFAALIAGERVTGARTAGAALVVVGVAALALG